MISSDEWNGSQWAHKKYGKDTKSKFFGNTFLEKSNKVCEN
jgi:hypothetical protein